LPTSTTSWRKCPDGHWKFEDSHCLNDWVDIVYFYTVCYFYHSRCCMVMAH
jgi:hypothetical protein